MTNPFYNPNFFAAYSVARAETVNTELQAIADAFARLPTPLQLATMSGTFFSATMAGPNAYVGTVAGLIGGSYRLGTLVVMRPPAANTGPATVNINGMGTVEIRTNRNEPLSPGMIQPNAMVAMAFNGTAFVLAGMPGPQGLQGLQGLQGVKGDVGDPTVFYGFDFLGTTPPNVRPETASDGDAWLEQDGAGNAKVSVYSSGQWHNLGFLNQRVSYPTVEAMLADTTNHPEGSFITADPRGFRYLVLPADSQQWHLITASGVKLELQPTQDGWHVLDGMGAKGNGIHDDAPLYRRLMQTVRVEQRFTGQGPQIFLSPNKTYYFGDRIDLKHVTKTEGPGSGLPGGIPPTVIFRRGVPGFVVHQHNTIGDTRQEPPGPSASGSTFRGFRLVSLPSNNTEAHAIRLRCRAVIEDMQISNWGGNGIEAWAGFNGDDYTLGNANLFSIRRTRIWYVTYGVRMRGADANAGYGEQVDVVHARKTGIADESFLGNTWVGCHVATTGWQISQCVFEGTTYAAEVGATPQQLVDTEPGTNPLVWRVFRAGREVSQRRRWEPGLPVGTFEFHGAYSAPGQSARSLFLGCYSEGDCSGSMAGQNAMFVGGTIGDRVRRGAHLTSRLFSTFSNTGFASDTQHSSGRRVQVVVNGNPNIGELLRLESWQADGADYSGPLRLRRVTNTVRMDNSNLDARVYFFLTMPQHPRPHLLGTSRLILDSASGARTIARASRSGGKFNLPPAGTSVTQGDMWIATNPTVGAESLLLCTKSGIVGAGAEFGITGVLTPYVP